MNKMRQNLISIVLLTISLAIWAQATPGPTPGGNCQITVFGYVTNVAGNPIAGAQVVADTSSTTTDAAGYYTITRIQANCNAVYVRISAAGYETVTKSSAGGAHTELIDFVLNATGATPTPTAGPTARPTATCNAKRGDVNNDGTISIVDALMIAQYAVGLNPPGFVICAADLWEPCVYLTCFYEINILDALKLAQYCVGLISQL